MSRAVTRKIAGYVLAILGIAAVTGALGPIQGQVNSTTVALALLVIVLLTATFWGRGPAVLASVAGMLSFNFFFLPPLYTWTIDDTQNWVALVAFLVTALTAGQLSERGKRRAKEAEAGRREIERLYTELRTAFERASYAEALKQSERLKSALLDAVTHDIRTPLTAIKASVTTLLDETNTDVESAGPVKLDNASRREMLEVINEETDRLNRFVEGLVELARIEAGELQLRLRWGTVEDIITSALARAQSLIHNHSVEVEVDHELPVVRVDAKAVSEVIYNLLENAAKFSPPGSKIRVSAQHWHNGTISMAVEDEGIGIPLALRERVFEKFFRGERTDDFQFRGTGMGLSIAKGIVEAHSGRIWIENGPSRKGTRILLTLPIGDDDNSDSSESIVLKEVDFVR